MRLSAPGKLFLTGEYAVLWGAPAVLAAVGPRMRARVVAKKSPSVLSVPGAILRNAGDGWQGPREPARFALRALELAALNRRISIHLSRSARGRNGGKLGLGSSATATVLAAACALGEPVDRDAVFRLAARAHLEVQNGKGSNGDVAAACHGGVIRYLRFEVDSSSKPDVTALPHVGLRLALVFSGTSAKTPSMVAAVERALSAEDRAAFVALSTACTDRFVRALELRDDTAAIAALNDSGDLLAALGSQAGVEVVTPVLAKLQRIGRAHGVAAKISGAGGGDSVVFAAFRPGPLEDALRAARAEGFQTMQLEIGDGLRVDPRQTRHTTRPPSRPPRGVASPAGS